MDARSKKNQTISIKGQEFIVLQTSQVRTHTHTHPHLVCTQTNPSPDFVWSLTRWERVQSPKGKVNRSAYQSGVYRYPGSGGTQTHDTCAQEPRLNSGVYPSTGAYPTRPRSGWIPGNLVGTLKMRDQLFVSIPFFGTPLSIPTTQGTVRCGKACRHGSLPGICLCVGEEEFKCLNLDPKLLPNQFIENARG